MQLNSVIISRTDSIGDVVLTLPMAGVIKLQFPQCKVYFLGRSYTRAIVNTSVFVDEFINADDYPEADFLAHALNTTKADAIIHVFPDKKIVYAAKKAGIPIRIGTSHRLYNWLGCNRRVNFSRKNSNLHEGQLNLKLLQPIITVPAYTTAQLPAYYGMQRIQTLSKGMADLIDKSRFNLILHPLSNRSAREWGLENFSTLISLLPADKFKIFISGTATDGGTLTDFIATHAGSVTNITGQMDLASFISFINRADGLVAASTGPLHIAAALGKHAVGIYPPTRPIHPGRWAPLGTHAKVFVNSTDTNPTQHLQVCPHHVADYLLSLV